MAPPLTWGGVNMRSIVFHQHLGHCGVRDLEGLVIWRLEVAENLLPIPKVPPAGSAGKQ